MEPRLRLSDNRILFNIDSKLSGKKLQRPQDMLRIGLGGLREREELERLEDFFSRSCLRRSQAPQAEKPNHRFSRCTTKTIQHSNSFHMFSHILKEISRLFKCASVRFWPCELLMKSSRAVKCRFPPLLMSSPRVSPPKRSPGRQLVTPLYPPLQAENKLSSPITLLCKSYSKTTTSQNIIHANIIYIIIYSCYI